MPLSELANSCQVRRARFIHINNIRQVASKHRIRPVQIYAPMPTETRVALYRRMPLLPKTICRTLVLLTQNSYSFLPDIVSTAEVNLLLSSNRIPFTDIRMARRAFSFKLFGMWKPTGNCLGSPSSSFDRAGTYLLYW